MSSVIQEYCTTSLDRVDSHMYYDPSKLSTEMLEYSLSRKIQDLHTRKPISSEPGSQDFSGLRQPDGLSSREEPISSRERYQMVCVKYGTLQDESGVILLDDSLSRESNTIQILPLSQDGSGEIPSDG